jgi:hypothetical protein
MSVRGKRLHLRSSCEHIRHIDTETVIPQQDQDCRYPSIRVIFTLYGDARAYLLRPGSHRLNASFDPNDPRPRFEPQPCPDGIVGSVLGRVVPAARNVHYTYDW